MATPTDPPDDGAQDGAGPDGGISGDDTWVEVNSDPAHAARERARARDLRKSGFWQRKLQAGLCAYCGKKFAPRELTMDHVVPVARGGRSTRGNVVPACKPCNNEKKLLTPAERILLAQGAAQSEDEDDR